MDVSFFKSAVPLRAEEDDESCHAGHEEELSEVECCSDLCSATLENLSYDKSISSACIYWPKSQRCNVGSWPCVTMLCQ